MIHAKMVQELITIDDATMHLKVTCAVVMFAFVPCAKGKRLPPARIATQPAEFDKLLGAVIELSLHVCLLEVTPRGKFYAPVHCVAAGVEMPKPLQARLYIEPIVGEGFRVVMQTLHFVMHILG